MKLQIASDLDLEFLNEELDCHSLGITPAPEADLLVLAGNVHAGMKGIEHFATWPKPVVYVPGNREYFENDFLLLRDKFKATRTGTYPSVIALDRDVYEYMGVRFVGTTLWTDFALYGDRKEARRIAASELYDYKYIRIGLKPFETGDALREHTKSLAWLDRVLHHRFSGPTVVVTHHAPHPNSLEKYLEDSDLNPTCVSDLTRLLGRSELWIHGHVQRSCDYVLSGTRILANPRGLPDPISLQRASGNLRWENACFDSLFTVDVAVRRT
ncbi:metallophosphoesterase [Cupriavidus pauculus]|uniref:Metallophosphoesterase n=1 Tax=Cupriavidus pauculus TaxID=82633 RepID=A0A2N5C3P5_9BURK|nr:metallophosphoesterase [Cupriavidus pauculus]PLP96841.1 metallophosphoesterase [Cupriavidus pauculus]